MTGLDHHQNISYTEWDI